MVSTSIQGYSIRLHRNSPSAGCLRADLSLCETFVWAQQADLQTVSLSLSRGLTSTRLQTLELWNLFRPQLQSFGCPNIQQYLVAFAYIYCTANQESIDKYSIIALRKVLGLMLAVCLAVSFPASNPDSFGWGQLSCENGQEGHPFHPPDLPHLKTHWSADSNVWLFQDMTCSLVGNPSKRFDEDHGLSINGNKAEICWDHWDQKVLR